MVHGRQVGKNPALVVSNVVTVFEDSPAYLPFLNCNEIVKYFRPENRTRRIVSNGTSSVSAKINGFIASLEKLYYLVCFQLVNL